MIDGSVLQSAQQCFEKKSRVVVKIVVRHLICNLNGVVDATKQHSNSNVLHKGEPYFETVKFSKSKMPYLIHYLSH